jgi:hypothetical protein
MKSTRWLLLAFALGASAAHAQWMLFGREAGCVSMQQLVRMERLDRAPATPEEFADAMRARGHKVTLGLPEGFPADMQGKAVMVRYGESRAPIFLRMELCKSGGGR